MVSHFMSICQLNCSAIDEYLGCYQFGVIVNGAAIIILIRVLSWARLNISFGYTARCIIWSSEIKPKHFSKLAVLLASCVWKCNCSASLSTLGIVSYFTFILSTGFSSISILVLICIFLLTNKVEHFLYAFCSFG